jgi:hypothetical protein
MKKEYGLLRCYPYGNISGNNCIGECMASDITEAIQLLQPSCPATLDSKGYAKVGEITFVICETFG